MFLFRNARFEVIYYFFRPCTEKIVIVITFTNKKIHSIPLLNVVFPNRNMIFICTYPVDAPLFEQSDRLSDPNVANFAPQIFLSFFEYIIL